jgi:uncharacterized phage protein gp47/JayE
MAYAPPTINGAGLTIPMYLDILNYLLAQYAAIYGPSVYLQPDGADWQDTSIRALQASDVDNAIQAVYVAFNPLTATGPSLDLIGQLIGPPRKSASFSTATVTLSGTGGTVINGGIVQDVSGNYWSLPATVTIGVIGTVNATVTAQIQGPVTANPGAISIISTPTAGWTSVTNPASAAIGQPVESDSVYRARLLISQAQPSITLLAGTAAALAALSGVTRSMAYENYTGTTQSFGACNTSGTTVTQLVGYPFDSTMAGNPFTIGTTPYTIASVSSTTVLVLTTSAGTQTNVAYSSYATAIGPKNSITCVVEGGTSAAIAQAIYNNKGIGPFTNGTTTVTVTDPNNGNLSQNISYDAIGPTQNFGYGYIPISVGLDVHPLTGFTSATQLAIQNDVLAYLNSLGIGQPVVWSELFGAALNARSNADQPTFAITAIQDGYQAAQTTATLNNTTTIVVASAMNIAVGQVVFGTGIQLGSVVASMSGTNIVLSLAATSSASGVQVNFFTVVSAGATINIAFNQVSLGLAGYIGISLV